ncbi:MAG: CCA tRNA nucleotidyltransferase [Gemmatimonadota bacterium]|nr:MAG: CCA tRNA nucleotidyltransferase [Gemmatimonadota bacterium]
MAASSAARVGDRETRLEIPEAVREIAQRLEDHGHETWAVGGAVRDALSGENRSDWDLATQARPETVRKLFRPSYPIGIRFGTVGVRGRDGRVYEVTTFRRDIETDGRHAVVEYADRLDEDLSRRDFTINAIAYHPLRGVVHDPFSGMQDLERRVLRCVGEPEMRFAEDYLRVLRGLRFAGRYGLEIEPQTWEALRAAVGRLTRLSGERVREEIIKVLMAERPSSSLSLYRDSGALAVIMPELADGGWAESLRTIDAIDQRRLLLRLSVLLSAAGPATEEMMRRLRFSNAEIRDVVALGGAVETPLPEAGDVVGGRRWLRKVQPQWALDALRLHFAAARARPWPGARRARLAGQARLLLGILRRGDPVTLADLAIDGEDLKALGLRPGPDFGRILEGCLDVVIEAPESNQRELLLEHVRGRISE